MKTFLVENGGLIAISVLIGFAIYLLACGYYLAKCLLLSSYIEQYRRYGEVRGNELIGKLEYVTRPLPDPETNSNLFRAEKIRNAVGSVRTLRKVYIAPTLLFAIAIPAVIIGKFLL